MSQFFRGFSSTGAPGDVIGTPPSTDNAIARYDGTTGLIIQNSTVTVDDNGSINSLAAYAGNTKFIQILNNDNTAGSASKFSQLVGGTSAGDVYNEFIIGAARSFSLGVDNDDSQTFKLTTDASGNVDPSTGTTLIDVTSGGQISFPSATLTENGLMLVGASGLLESLGQAANGEIPMGSTGADPVLSTITAGTGIGIVNAAGSITVNLDVEAQVSLSTGLITGGILSVGTPPNKFSISDGNGVIVDCTTDPAVPTVTSVSWSGKTDIIVTGIAAQLITFILIDNTGSVIQQSTAPTQAQRRTHITLGVVVHVDLVNVDAVNNEQQACINPGAQLYDLMDGLGFFNVSGNVFSPNAAANLTFDKSVGKIVKAGSNWNISPQNPHILTLASLVIASFQYRFQGGTNGVTGTVIDPDIYDVAGVSTPVPNSKYTIQRIYSFISNNVKIQPGQALYNSLAEAKASIQIESFVTEPSILANGLLRGFLCIKKGATDLTDTNEAFFISAGKFGGTSGIGGLSVSTLQNAYDNSIDPEIVINSTNGALSIQDAAVPIGANLFEVQSNGAGSTFFNVTASGADIDGVLTLTTDLAVDHGGSARSSATAYSVICGGTTATAAHQSVASVGTAGQALLSNGAGALPTFQNVPGGSGITWLATATASTSATLEFTSLINSDFNTFLFIFDHIAPVTDAAILVMRTSTNAGVSFDSGAGEYRYNGGTGTYLIIAQDTGNAANEHLSGQGYLTNPSAATYTGFNFEGYKIASSTAFATVTSAGERLSAADVDAVQFLYNTGNLASGTIRMYGMTTPS